MSEECDVTSSPSESGGIMPSVCGPPLRSPSPASLFTKTPVNGDLLISPSRSSSLMCRVSGSSSSLIWGDSRACRSGWSFSSPSSAGHEKTKVEICSVRSHDGALRLHFIVSQMFFPMLKRTEDELKKPTASKVKQEHSGCIVASFANEHDLKVTDHLNG